MALDLAADVDYTLHTHRQEGPGGVSRETAVSAECWAKGGIEWLDWDA